MCGRGTLILVYLVVRGCLSDTDTGFGELLLNQQNQDIINHLGTRYEVVYPFQIRKDWVHGLSTRVSTHNGTVRHLQRTTLLLETYEYKLQLELELNTKLFAPTLVQFMYSKNSSLQTAQELPENCYYHAKVMKHPGARGAFQTCNGIRGVIYLEDKIYFIHPLHGHHSGKRPHLLYHYSPEKNFICGNSLDVDPARIKENFPNVEEGLRNKYVEVALVLDRSLFLKYKSPSSEVLSAAVEIINYVDLLYLPLNTSISLVYLELWLEDQIQLESDLSVTLERFKKYVDRRISRISVDTTHLMTGQEFAGDASGQAYKDSICTKNAVGITKVENAYEPHLASFVLSHMIGHTLGMEHDQTVDCKCSDGSNCIMDGNQPLLSSTQFSSCSMQDYHQTLVKGHGACLYNMPTLRMSVCGNGILEEGEECDCGTIEECTKVDPCCDSSICKFVKHAQCSSGPCCKKCKLLSPDHLCRSSRGECDVPEFCDGQNRECPQDLYKKDGSLCSKGLGYCYLGSCPVLKHQCQDVWGEGANSADKMCYERLNLQGTPNGNCGLDKNGHISKCSSENSNCGFLQCSEGERSPVSLEDLPIRFVIHKMNKEGTIVECKARIFPMQDLHLGLVKDGTACGYHKLCINQSCTNIRTIVSGRCPMEEVRNICTGHGTCTNINTCFCDDGWKGPNCSIVDEDSVRSGKKDLDYYDPIDEYKNVNPYLGQNEMKVNPNLPITVIAACIVIGIGLVVIAILFLFCKNI